MSSSPLSSLLRSLAKSPVISRLLPRWQLSVSAPSPVVTDSEVPVSVTGVPPGETCVIAIDNVATKTVTAPPSGPVTANLKLAAFVAPGDYTITATLPASSRTASKQITVIRDQRTYTKQK